MHKLHVDKSILSFNAIKHTQIHYTKLKFTKNYTHRDHAWCSWQLKEMETNVKCCIKSQLQTIS
jgi:hypothetical protein